MNKIMLAVLAVLFGSCTFLYAQKGYPERNGIKDIYAKFLTPPPGYGEVPFYWWQADTLTKERLTWQLDQLAKKRITSLQVNYSHTDDRKGLFWGSSYKSQPEQFSDKWWDLFGWFMKEASKRGMTVSVSDYTLGVGQGYAIDEVRKLHPDVAASKLCFDRTEHGKGSFSMHVKDNLLSVVAYRSDNIEKKINLTDKVDNGELSCILPGGRWIIVTSYYEVDKDSYDPMHPLAGKEYVNHFFQKFEDKFPQLSKGNLDFFFSDELNFNLPDYVWDERFASEFIKRKGYDVRPLLAALVMDIGRVTTKVRMDYNDVFTSLSEENYFRPVYQWHADRNLIFGCDHGGRGYFVDEFGDYFRTQRWNQGPGSDQPHLGKDIIKAKVASSIAHMYSRPRVWLEGFYSSGWGTTSEALVDAIFSDFAMGYNLLSLHGLYYATPGSLWEWAPPCNHFRMPYWATMDKTLEAVERLAYLFSQGYHKCDVAILYPVEPKISGYGKDASNAAFAAGKSIYSHGLDFDFMDYSSLRDAKVNNGSISVPGESYKVVVVPSMRAIKDASLRKLGEFANSGGIIINIGALPETTDAYGKDSIYVTKLLKPMLSGKNYYSVEKPDEVLPLVEKKIVRDFSVMDTFSYIPYINHRKFDDKNIYGVYNVPAGTKCFFRSFGDVEYWDVWSGMHYKLTGTETTGKGTVVEMPKGRSEYQIIAFLPHSDAEPLVKPSSVSQLTLPDQWNSEIVPVLDNRFGDYHYPATDEKIGAEMQRYHYKYTTSSKDVLSNAKAGDFNWDKVTYTYGDEFFCSGATDKNLSDDYLSSLDDIPDGWKPYSFSRRWGVEDDPGHQGYHGMKMSMNPEVIKLGRMVQMNTTTIRESEKAGDNYYLYTTVKAPYSGSYDVLMADSCAHTVAYQSRKGDFNSSQYDAHPTRCFINGEKVSLAGNSVQLKKGINRVVLCYDHPVITYFFIRDRKVNVPKQERLALRWYNDNSILPFDPYGGKQGYGWYCFESAPGLEGFSFSMKGEPRIWVDGESVNYNKVGDTYDVTLKNCLAKPSVVSMLVKLPYGTKGGAAFTSELKQRTGNGIVSVGDWGMTDGLETYSGGVRYSQTVNIGNDMLKCKVYLKIDDLSSTVELRVNGKYVGARVCPEWKFDVTGFLKAGNNDIEMTVYNTASNHYKTMPTQFKGNAKSGILGKVSILYETNAAH